ncbi:hypothetical protein [Comamonas testosteroni]|uniref:hypothetical protein n=1 Tax=Comamonas testosteroni TaxID=285 RepID=UPI0012FF05E5|nr:hypothetical protein [Comamonas testosteroni]
MVATVLSMGWAHPEAGRRSWVSLSLGSVNNEKSALSAFVAFEFIYDENRLWFQAV